MTEHESSTCTLQVQDQKIQLHQVRIYVGSEFNRWLNISRVDLVGGAEDPNSKIFQCEVCAAHGTPSEECYTANYTNHITGSPPMILETNSKNRITCNGM